MNIANVKIGDIIAIPEVEIVVRLGSDDDAIRKAITSFVVTADVGAHLHLLVEALKRPCGQGFFLQGDFGSGKSHFLAALYAFFQRAAGFERLAECHEELRLFREQGKVIFPVAISLVDFRGTTPLEGIIVEALESALWRTGRQTAFTRRGAVLVALSRSLDDRSFEQAFSERSGILPRELRAWTHTHPAEAAIVAEKLLEEHGISLPAVPVRERKELFEAVATEIRIAGYDGCLLLIDELSEFFRSKSDAPKLNDDARTLQLLGELSASYPLWIIAAVQESVERTGDIAQATFRKIKDRYPIKFHLSTVHIRDLIGKRLIHVKNDGDRAVFAVYETFRRYFPHFTCTPALFHSIYPVHPYTLELLEGLGDLFSQHRGIVDFIHAQIAGDPSRGIRGILDRPCCELLAPDAIYDHFSSRIAEFSPFYIYPSRIVPHLDTVIDSVLTDDADRTLAKRLIRIIVLHTIHPTAKPPDAQKLAELVACMLSFSSPDANAQYIAEVLLDPVVVQSRFLVKTSAASGAVMDATYSITTADDDRGKLLQARIDRVTGEIDPSDTRLFTGPLSELPESYSWPGPSLFTDAVHRHVTWRQSVRVGIVTIATKGSEDAVSAKLEALYAAGNADFGFVVTLDDCTIHCPHTAVWRIDAAIPGDKLLTEYFASKTVLGELRPGNPADIPLIPLIKERIRKMEAAVFALLLQRMYRGSFVNCAAAVDPAVRQVMRFDRLLELAAEELCEIRYPDFKEIASRGLPPSLRLYQRLYEEFIVSGTISLRDARARGLTESIETLVAPLGLVEVKNGQYLLAPQPSTNSFLACVFGRLNSSTPRLRSEIMQELQNGPYGVPHETACFLFASLAQCGLVSLINHGRALPPDYIKLLTIDQVEAVAPGELINQADREAILRDCQFLLTSGKGETFDVRRQREAWDAAIKFKSTMTAHLDALAPQAEAVAEYAAFRHFDFDAITDVCSTIRTVIDEIKVSYAARDGLERFIAAWRASGLVSDDLMMVKQTGKFLVKHADKIIFVSHYCNHPSVIAAAQADASVDHARNEVLSLLEQPQKRIVPDEGERLQEHFEQFRELYIARYSDVHAKVYSAAAVTPLTKHAERNLTLLRRLAALAALDRPSGTQQFLASIDAPLPRPCSRNPGEELIRSPVCGCNVQFGDEPTPAPGEHPEAAIDRLLNGYCRILKGAELLEALSAQAFALRDIDRGTSKRLSALHALLKEQQMISVHTLADLLDETTITAIDRALSGRARIEQRSFSALRENLGGRRLNAARIRSVIDEWIGKTGEEIIFSIEDASGEGEKTSSEPVLWPRLHPELFGALLPESAFDHHEVIKLQDALERRFPASSLTRQLINAPTSTLLAFMCSEPVHRMAIAAAWCILAKRVLTGSAELPDNGSACAFLDKNEAARIAERIDTLRSVCHLSNVTFPRKLLQRMHFAAIFNDPWADASVKNEALAAIGPLLDTGADWMSTLPQMQPIECGSPQTVVIVDAIPADVWLSLDVTYPGLFPAPVINWFRLSSAGRTIDGLNELFGFPNECDPQTELTSRTISYGTITGDEQYLWGDQLPEAQPDRARVVRVALFDRQVHDGLANLTAMSQQLGLLLTRNIPHLLENCCAKGHRLIITTDHGLSFSAKGLHHGTEGLYERVIFRAVL